MPSRIKLAATAAATGLLAGTFAFGLAPAQAAPPTVLVECDTVSATAGVSPGITNVDRGQRLRSLTSSMPAGCATNVFAGITGAPAATNPLSVSLSTPNRAPFGDKNIQGLSCASPSNPATSYPPSGRARVTWTNLAPPTNLRPFTTDAFVRLQGPTDADIHAATNQTVYGEAAYPDVAKMVGLVTRGAGLGADIDALIIYQPIAENKVTIPGGSFIDPNTHTIVPGFPSALAGLACQGGTSTLTGILIATDGISMGTLLDPNVPPIDSQVRVSFPF